MNLIVVLLILILAFVLWSSTSGKLYHVWGTNIEEETTNNKFWRKVLNTSENTQLVVMNVPVGEELGWEVHHDSDQMFRTERGSGVIQYRPSKTGEYKTIDISKDRFDVVPRGNYHNVVNTGNEPLQFYAIYSPPHHPPDRIDETKVDELRREGRL